MTGPNHADDDLLAALDQFVNTVHWLRVRTPYTASEALIEGLTDWIAEHAGASIDDRPEDLGSAVTQFIVAVQHLPADDTEMMTESALAEALDAWAAAVSAEHHRSQPFPPR
jgi:hypothetical protein